MKFTGNKSKMVQQLYLDLLNILETIGISMENLSDRRKEKMAGACLATGQIIESFKEVKSIMDGCFLKTRDIIEFENAHYGEQISSGSYDDIRRKDLKPLTDMGLVLSSSLLDQSATNNPHRGYALDAQFAGLLKVLARANGKPSYLISLRLARRPKRSWNAKAPWSESPSPCLRVKLCNYRQASTICYRRKSSKSFCHSSAWERKCIMLATQPINIWCERTIV